MKGYLAVSSDTTSGNTSCSYTWDVDPKTYSDYTTNSTAPRELIRGATRMIEGLIKSNLILKLPELEIITNNQFLISVFTDNQLQKWKQSYWLRSNGEPIKNKDLLELLDTAISYCTERHTVVRARRPEGFEEEAKFGDISRLALSIRKHKGC